jgi:hypothetical protein
MTHFTILQAWEDITSPWTISPVQRESRLSRKRHDINAFAERTHIRHLSRQGYAIINPWLREESSRIGIGVVGALFGARENVIGKVFLGRSRGL